MAEVIRSITGGLHHRARPSAATSQLDDDSGKTAPCDSRRVCFEAYPLSGLPPALPIDRLISLSDHSPTNRQL
ncbi:hypothetical protein [Rhizobium sp. YK2]|uniref:hypothetical protein n=1 Tax=Rhizobium sp. YK2 TaxID=1860096 RepID=UPI00114CE876|nr:hypothetical protein [Rhizobium sp. YK2]